METVPNRTLVELAFRGDVPAVPDSERFEGEPEALLVIVMFPESAPAAVGNQVTVRGVLAPWGIAA